MNYSVNLIGRKIILMVGMICLMMASVACGGAADESNVELVTNTPLPTATAVPDESEPSAQAVTETPASATAEPTATEEAATEEPTAEPTPTPSPTALPVNELTYPVEFVPGDCPFPLPDHPSAIECGTIEVPEARANADNGRTITLSVAVFRSVARGALADPIIYLDGGPGGNTLEVVQFTYSNLIAPYVTERDFIIFDQRGIGYSEPSLDCPEILDLTLESLNGQFSEEEELDLYLLAIDDCRSRLASEGVNLRAFNSAESAADVEDIRRALGYESLNLYGISYGTRLAQTIMRDYPDHIRSVILDSPVPIEGDLQAETPIHISQALAKFFKGCAEDEACGVAYPELENRFYALVDTLNEAPITFPITYILTGNRYDVVFSGEDFIDMLFQSLYSDEIFPLMPAVISQVEEGSYDQLSLVFTNFLINNEFISYGMYYSVNCQEEFAFSDRVAVEQNSQADPLLIDYLDSWETTFDTCDVWDVGEANTIENEPVVSDIPTLILAGEYDPITPIGWGLQIEGNLGRDTFVPFPSVGHGVTTSDPCGAEIALSFLFEPALTPDMSCTQDVGDPAFEVPREVATTPDEIVMVPFEGDFFGVPFAGAKPESWEGVPDIDGTFIRGDTPFDQTFLQHQVLELGVFSDIEVSILTYLNQLSEDEAQAVEPYVDTGEREWRMYEFSFQGIPAIGGFANQEEILFFIFLTYQTEEEGAFLVENVLQPSMDAVVSE